MTKLLSLNSALNMLLTEYFSDIKINCVNQTLSSFVSQQIFRPQQALFIICNSFASCSESLGHVASHCFAYDDEPLEEPGQNTVDIPNDADKIPPATLEQRSDSTIPLNQWQVLLKFIL